MTVTLTLRSAPACYDRNDHREEDSMKPSGRNPADSLVGRSNRRFIFDCYRFLSEHSERVAYMAKLDAEANGGEIHCAAGCSHCCKQIVNISTYEAMVIATYLTEDRSAAEWFALAHPVWKKKVLSLPPTKSSLFPGVYASANIPCPFCAAGKCLIYPVRPLFCSQYFSSTPPDGSGFCKMTASLKAVCDEMNQEAGWWFKETAAKYEVPQPEFGILPEMVGESLRVVDRVLSQE